MIFFCFYTLLCKREVFEDYENDVNFWGTPCILR